MFRILLLGWFVLAALMMTLPVFGALTGIVSDRAAAETANAVDLFLKDHSDRVFCRTPSQLAEMTDDQIRDFFKGGEAIFLAGVFGDQVPRLLNILASEDLPESTPVIAVSSDTRLVFASRYKNGPVFPDVSQYEKILKPSPDEDTTMNLDPGTRARQAFWLKTHNYWTGRGAVNLARMLKHLKGGEEKPPPPESTASLNYRFQGQFYTNLEQIPFGDAPVTAVLDLDVGSRTGMSGVHEHITEAMAQEGFETLSVFARWGEASWRAVESLTRVPKLAGFVSLQDFVVGGGERREQVSALLKDLDIPVIHGIRLTDLTSAQWRASPEGLPWRSIHYRVAMPEIQGIGQPLVVACAGPPRIHQPTGLKLTWLDPQTHQIKRLVRRVRRWRDLRITPRKEKRLAIVYYNHPPGRHNIGADNLDVVQSLWDMLNRLKKEGYHTGELPDSPKRLLERLQEVGVNLPENNEALSHQARHGLWVSPQQYEPWFSQLPAPLRREMVEGPLGYLHERLKVAVRENLLEEGERFLEATLTDLHHILEKTASEDGRRARSLMDQLKSLYKDCLSGKASFEETEPFVQALVDLGIEGLRGWGPPPGRVMVHDEKMLIPGLIFGNIFVGPQPPRGWELDEEALHANLAFPPTHQYMGFYFWLNHTFRAHAYVHLGRHSTYEFLPRRRAGLNEEDYSWHVADEIPGVYPYIVDGVGEGIQAKRRGLAVMVDHLTPPLSVTPLYDDLLTLRDLVESYEAAAGGDDNALRTTAVARIRGTITDLNLHDELLAELRHELHDETLVLDRVDDELLVHEVGHYLTHLQESFMPLGLHVFGRPWKEEAVNLMMTSLETSSEKAADLRTRLVISPEREMEAFLGALDGRFVEPGEGNDPIRTPAALPTGRNFHAVGGDVLPTRVAYDLGLELAQKAVEGQEQGGHGVVLWASDTVRDQGVMAAFGLALMGVKPKWNSRGIVKDVELLAPNMARQDVIFTTSGLFRDLYGGLLALLDRAALVALAASANAVVQSHPELTFAMEAALEPLGNSVLRGDESLDSNHLARAWVESTQRSLAAGRSPKEAGTAAATRIFGDAPGAYGAGVNRLVERSGAWEARKELAQAYATRMGHGYGTRAAGEPVHDRFRDKLANVRFTYLGRSSNLYGLMDNNDGFDYLGGLSLAVEVHSGQVPMNRVMDYARPDRAEVRPLATALLSELRGRYLNPAWIKPLMEHGYSGARTMSSKFMENLWGWQVTNPDVVHGWVWDEVKQVYMDDGHGLGLDQFLDQQANAPVKANMLAIFLVAAQKGFWEPDRSELTAMAEAFVDLVREHGLPGSGHTTPDHPIMDMIVSLVDSQRASDLREVLAKSKSDLAEAIQKINRVSELQTQPQGEASPSSPGEPSLFVFIAGALLGLILLSGIRQGLKPMGE